MLADHGTDPAIPQVIRPPPPDLVQQHSPLPTPASGNSPQHRPSPSPSPPYRTQGGPGRPVTLRERRNSTSSVSVSTRIVTSLDRGLTFEIDFILVGMSILEGCQDRELFFISSWSLNDFLNGFGGLLNHST